MKSIIFPTDKFDNLSSLTAHVPEYLLPIVNKPIVEHLVELMVRNGIKDINVVVRHMPDEVKEYFGNGERWGADITYLQNQECCGTGDIFDHISSDQNESFLCLSGNIVTNLDVSDLVKTHVESRTDMTISLQSKTDNSPVSILPGKTESTKEISPFIITSQVLSQILLDGEDLDIKNVVIALSDMDLLVNVHSSSYDFKGIQSVEDYWMSNKQILNGRFKGIIIPGKQRQDGIWSGRRTSIHSNVKMKSPLLIGDCCEIRKNVSIEKDTIVGNSVLLDHDASVSDSVIFGNTYVGPQTEIKASIVWKKYLLNVSRMVKTFVTDDFILGDMERSTMLLVVEKFFNKASASTILVLLSPVVFLLYLCHLILPSKGLIVSDEMFSNLDQFDHDGNKRLSSFNLYSFKCRNRFVKALPGMLNVIKGDLRLLGKPPLSRTQADLRVDVLASTRADDHFGLFDFRKGGVFRESTCNKTTIDKSQSKTRYSFWESVKIRFG